MNILPEDLSLQLLIIGCKLSHIQLENSVVKCCCSKWRNHFLFLIKCLSGLNEYLRVSGLYNDNEVGVAWHY